MSWETLISVLEDIGLGQLAKSIRDVKIECCYPLRMRIVLKGGADCGGHYFHQLFLKDPKRRLNAVVQFARGMSAIGELHSEGSVLEEPSVSKKLLPFKFYV